MKKIIAVMGAPIKSNSSFGNYTVPCEVEYVYGSNVRRMIENSYFWTAKKANEFYSYYGGAK